ncbi:MAG: TIGR04086 family membrane protein [Clostridia bacterium]|nr:TIGR04086 family membrane protein [Clostridia bacterium]
MPKNRKRRSSSSQNTDPRKDFITKMVKGSIVTAISFFILLFLLALLVVHFNVSDSVQNIAVFFFALFASFLGSFFALRKTQEKGLVSGVILTVPAVSVVCLVLFAVLHTLGARTLIMSGLMMAGGMLGGIAAVNFK